MSPVRVAGGFSLTVLLAGLGGVLEWDKRARQLVRRST